MSIHEGHESIAVALRETAERIEAPVAEFLYEGAVRRGKQIRRRRRTGAALTGVVAIGAAAVAVAGLSGTGRAAPPPAPVATISPKDLPKYMATTACADLEPAPGRLATEWEWMCAATGKLYASRGPQHAYFG